jgi:hypothetical protein
LSNSRRRLGGFQIDDQFEFGRLFDWQIGRSCHLEDTIDIERGAAVQIAHIDASVFVCPSGGEEVNAERPRAPMHARASNMRLARSRKRPFPYHSHRLHHARGFGQRDERLAAPS